jgi:hypothetical protein
MYHDAPLTGPHVNAAPFVVGVHAGPDTPPGTAMIVVNEKVVEYALVPPAFFALTLQ